MQGMGTRNVFTISSFHDRCTVSCSGAQMIGYICWTWQSALACVIQNHALQKRRVAAASGEVPAREGVLRLMDEAREQGLLVGVCSAATKSSAICVLESLLGKDRFQVRRSLCSPYKEADPG